MSNTRNYHYIQSVGLDAKTKSDLSSTNNFGAYNSFTLNDGREASNKDIRQVVLEHAANPDISAKSDKEQVATLYPQAFVLSNGIK